MFFSCASTKQLPDVVSLSTLDPSHLGICKCEAKMLLTAGLETTISTFRRSKIAHVVPRQRQSSKGGSMKYLRITLIGVTLAMASIGFGVAAVDRSSAESQGRASCQICGDGFCAPKCENARTCPQDCAPQPSR